MPATKETMSRPSRLWFYFIFRTDKIQPEIYINRRDGRRDLVDSDKARRFHLSRARAVGFHSPGKLLCISNPGKAGAASCRRWSIQLNEKAGEKRMSGPSDKRKPRERSHIDFGLYRDGIFPFALFLSPPECPRARSLLCNREFYRKYVHNALRVSVCVQGNVRGCFYFPLSEMKFVILRGAFDAAKCCNAKHHSYQSVIFAPAGSLAY